MSDKLPATLEPPIQSPPVSANTLSSQPWLEFHQGVADQLAALPAKVRKGVVDGSDATAGDIGEYLTASAAKSLSSGASTNVASLSLTAGDWDVSGDVAFVTGGGTLNSVGAGIGGVSVLINATFPAGATNQHLATATRRYNVTAATTTVWVVAVAFFSGTVTATGAVRARRMR